VSKLQSRRHLYYLTKYLQLAGLTVIGAAQVSAVFAIDTPPQLINKAKYTYDVDASVSGSSGTTGIKIEKNDPFTGEALTLSITADTNQLINNQKLVDPAGGITGCNGEILTSYEGFVVGLYQTPDRLKLGNLVALTPTEVPDIPNNGISEGVAPNGQNSNPFALTTGNVGGQYNFLLDRSKGQQNPGQSYILVIKPPAGSIYGERQILLDVVSSTTSSITFNVTSLDSQALSAGTGGGAATQVITTPIQELSTSLSLVGLNVGVCNPQTFQIIKSADRAAAEPGDTVIYRLVLKNLSATPIGTLAVTDTLPLGFQLQPNAIKARQDNADIPVTVTQNGNVATFSFPGTLGASKTINLAYATTLTPDAVRGSGRNSATLTGIRGDNNTAVTDGPAIHQLQVRQGILTDTGTIIGRVFVDKNFDGEQQPNEPGIPNAVIFLDDGNKVTTDANGMFSVKGATNGYRTGVLDLSSLPGYTLAPNLYFKERNSQSRLVKLAPSGLVRMNFGVTPTARETK
jgi:uncharacterized repeat protein (TIGR01451 family)